MLGRKRRGAYDRERFEPAIRCSICTGEQVAGFREKQTGAFFEVALIRDAKDLAAFCAEYGVEEPVRKFY